MIFPRVRRKCQPLDLSREVWGLLELGLELRPTVNREYEASASRTVASNELIKACGFERSASEPETSQNFVVEACCYQ